MSVESDVQAVRQLSGDLLTFMRSLPDSPEMRDAVKQVEHAAQQAVNALQQGT